MVTFAQNGNVVDVFHKDTKLGQIYFQEEIGYCYNKQNFKFNTPNLKPAQTINEVKRTIQNTFERYLK